MAVFYRTNAQSAALEEAMVRAEVPYKVVGGTKFYDRREVKDVMAYLKVLVNPDDEISWRRIVNVPKRGVGETVGGQAVGLGRLAGALLRGRGGPGRARSGIGGQGRHGPGGPVGAAGRLAGPDGRAPSWSTRTVTPSPRWTSRRRRARRRRGRRTDGPGRRAARSSPGDLVTAVVEDTGYRSELLAEGTIEALGRVENVDDPGRAWPPSTAPWPSSWRPPRWWPTPTSSSGDGTKVSLMTLHIAKGLEFPAVFLVGMEDGIFPHLRSLGDPVELEEERRLCYVGITRAERHLYVSHAWSRMVFGRE